MKVTTKGGVVAGVVVMAGTITAITTLIAGAVTGIGAFAVAAIVSALITVAVAAVRSNADPSGQW